MKLLGDARCCISGTPAMPDAMKGVELLAAHLMARFGQHANLLQISQSAPQLSARLPLDLLAQLRLGAYHDVCLVAPRRFDGV